MSFEYGYYISTKYLSCIVNVVYSREIYSDKETAKNIYWLSYLDGAFESSFYGIHYDPLMMSQKDSPRNHPWVLPKKVASLVRVPDSRLNDG